jgi:hypothetical protein
MKRPMRLMAVAAGVLAASAFAVCTHAAPSELFATQDDFTAPNQLGPPPPHRALQWDSKTGRWGVNFDMAQPGNRDLQGRDTRFGLNYQVVPGFRTGVGVSFGDEQLPDGRRIPEESAPRVRLQSSFKF